MQGLPTSENITPTSRGAIQSLRFSCHHQIRPCSDRKSQASQMETQHQFLSLASLLRLETKPTIVTRSLDTSICNWITRYPCFPAATKSDTWRYVVVRLHWRSPRVCTYYEHAFENISPRANRKMYAMGNTSRVSWCVRIWEFRRINDRKLQRVKNVVLRRVANS